MTNVSVRTCAFAAIILLLLSLPYTFGQTHVQPGGEVRVESFCVWGGDPASEIPLNEQTAVITAIAEADYPLQVTGPGGISTANMGWHHIGERAQTHWTITVPAGTAPGTYIVHLECYANSVALDVPTFTIVVDPPAAFDPAGGWGGGW